MIKFQEKISKRKASRIQNLLKRQKIDENNKTNMAQIWLKLQTKIVYDSGISEVYKLAKPRKFVKLIMYFLF